MAHSIKIGNGNETKYKSRPDINARSEEVKVRPDWNQIDPNAPDYVKNRTHGYERVKDLDVEFIMDVESTISYDFGFTMGYKGTLIYSDGTFPENSERIFCRVDCADANYMGKILELNRFDIPGALITVNDTYGYGNPAFYSFDPMDDNDLPILIAKGDNDGEWVVRYYDTFSQEMGGIQVQIGTKYSSSGNTMLVQLDEKYIPNTIARKSDIYSNIINYDFTKTIKLTETKSSVTINQYDNGTTISLDDLWLYIDCFSLKPSSGSNAITLKLKYRRAVDIEAVNTRNITLFPNTESKNESAIFIGHFYKNKFGILQCDYQLANDFNRSFYDDLPFDVNGICFGVPDLNRVNVPSFFYDIQEITLSTLGTFTTSTIIKIIGRNKI